MLGGIYRVEEPIGLGGMGTVYQGRDTSLDRPVAIKILRSRFNADQAFVQRFYREAKAMAAISHPNIVPIYAVGEDAGIHYFVMKLIDGETLREMIRREAAVNYTKALPIILQVCDGLGAIHTTGLVHRDVKASNIMIEPSGHVMLLDFGVLRDVAPEFA